MTHTVQEQTQLRHEPNLVRLPVLVGLVLGLVVLVGGSFLLMDRVFVYLAAQPAPAQAPTQLRAAIDPVPPVPRLQVKPRQDLQSLRTAEEARLGQYGWINREAGRVHIPIEQAMDVVAQKGLPKWAETAEAGRTPEELAP